MKQARLRSLRRAAIAICFAGILTAGCRTLIDVPDLNGIYDRAAQHHQRNPVVVIPGLLGTRLEDPATGRVVWGAFRRDFAHPGRARDIPLIGLPIDGTVLPAAADRAPVHVLDRFRASILGVPLSLKAYAGILATLGAGGYRDEGLALAGAVDWGDEHFTCFQFPYDWRRDNVYNAKRLRQFLDQKRVYLADKLDTDGQPIRFDIVAHSMGGMLLRYFLRYGDADLPPAGITPEPDWAGASWVERAVIVGTPNTGAVEALTNLVDGRAFGPLMPRYPAALIGTFESSYQLLPHPSSKAVIGADGQPLDTLAFETWRKNNWGLARIPTAARKENRHDLTLRALLPAVESAAERRLVASAYLEKQLERTRRFFDAMNTPSSPPDGLEIYLVAGDARPTPSQLEVSETGELAIVQYGPGDGRVTRGSALADLREGGDWQPFLQSPIDWTDTLFVFSDHLGMTLDPIFSDNVLYWLLEQPRDTAKDRG